MQRQRASIIHTRLDTEMLEALGVLAILSHATVAQVVRQALAAFVGRYRTQIAGELARQRSAQRAGQAVPTRRGQIKPTRGAGLRSPDDRAQDALERLRLPPHALR